MAPDQKDEQAKIECSVRTRNSVPDLIYIKIIIFIRTFVQSDSDTDVRLLSDHDRCVSFQSND